jgi:hypothetical protein
MSARLIRRSLLAGPVVMPTIALVSRGVRVVENRLSVITTVHKHGKQHSAMQLVDLDAVSTLQSVIWS